MIEDLENWMIENFIDFKFIEDDVFEIDGVGKFFVFDSKNEPLFDEGLSLNLRVANTDLDELLYEELKYTAFKFGSVWYYTSNELEVSQLKPLQSLGKAFLELESNYTHLGIHGHRELLNGSGSYDAYVNQAKFFGHKAIGICEKNTLAGCLLLQNSCKKNGIKSILGMTIDVIDVDGTKKEAKIYVENSIGWNNIMNISNIINNRDYTKKSIELLELNNHSNGLIFVFSKNWVRAEGFDTNSFSGFSQLYFQIDTTEYSSDAIDLHYLESARDWIRYTDFGKNDDIKPLLLSDSYYVHSSDFIVKKTLNQIDIGATHLQSTEQYFRPIEHHYDKLDLLVSDDDFNAFDDMFNEAVKNTMNIAVDCDFEINTDFLNMPEYELTEEEQKKYKDKYELFDAIVDSNWDERVPEGMDKEYEDRLEEEFRVIDGNGFLDYFLINWDWLMFCKRENIYTGVARGSAGGSVLSYLLGVTNIDPVKYNLLFERFLNEGRLKKTVKTKYILFHVNDSDAIITHRCDKLLKTGNGYFRADEVSEGDHLNGSKINKISEDIDEVVTAGSPPDIDSDVESIGRQRVKEYLEERYGKHRVLSIGTFTTLGIKSAISDVARVKGVATSEYRLLSKMITQKEVLAGFGLPELFLKAKTNDVVKRFIEDYPEVIEIARTVLGNSKSESVHAAGVIITPKYRDGVEVSAWDWIPTKIFDEQLVSEWEGEYLEQAGMLKLDLLGLNTLDKIHYVIDSIEKESGEKVDWHDIYTNRLEDKATFDIFSSGLTQNVFQFSSEDMTKFIKSMKPTNIEDICAANALFRPATMNLGYHEDYVEMKHGRKDAKYDWGLEDITKDTFGIQIYQEQMMQAVQKIGGFSLQESDAVRKAMGKKKQDLMDSYKIKFIDGAVMKGCDELEAIKIWNKIEQGASYGFNKCISGNEKIYRVGVNGMDKFRNPRFNPTISEMYKIRNDNSYAKSVNKVPLRHKYIGNGYGYGFSLNNEGKLIKNKIIDIRFEGVRETFKITLANGMSINTTDNHKFPTSNGEKMLKNLIVGKDKLYINDGYFQEKTCYNFTDKKPQNTKYHSSKYVEKFELNSAKGVAGFIEVGETSRKNLIYYSENLKKKCCEICGLRDCRLETHHVDGNHGNNDLCNLKTVCVSCHKKEHYGMGRTKMGEKGLHTKLFDIESIESNGVEEVYDVEMDSPYHTFATQGGVVTCNSHASAYALESYVTAYLKANYPVHFYTMSLAFSNDDTRPLILSEISVDGRIEIAPPHINESGFDFETDFEKNKIYWAIKSIKFVGDVAVRSIIDIRGSGGDFTSLENFVDRTEGKKVNKTHVVNLILSGAFDEIESLKSSLGRFGLIKWYYGYIGTEIPKDKFPTGSILNTFFWNRLQLELSGIGYIDYKNVFASSGFKEKFKRSVYLVPEKLSSHNAGKIVSVAGSIAEVKELSARNSGDKFGKIVLQSNTHVINVMIWSEKWKKFGEQMMKSKGRLCVINGVVSDDNFTGGKQIASYKGTDFKIM